jgi:hypothetical protein
MWVPGNWYHLVGTYDGTAIRLYVNGVLQASQAATGTLNDYGTSVRIGAFNNVSNNIDYTPGLFDEVAIHNRALPATEIAVLSGMTPNTFSFIPQTEIPLGSSIVSNPIWVSGVSGPTAISISGGEYAISSDGGATWGGWTVGVGSVGINDRVMVRLNSSPSYSALTTAALTIGGVSGAFSVTTAASGDPNANGLVSWWRGDDSPFDSVGGNHGTPTGNLSYAVGLFGQAFNFDGSTSFIHIPTATPLDRMPQFTLSAWLKIRGSHGGGTHLISGRAAGTQLYTDASGYLVFNIYDGSSWHPVTSKAPLPLETWVHIAGTLHSGVCESNLYINGVLEGSASISTLPAENSNPFNIGGFTGYGSYLNGLIDEVKLFSRSLSAIEVGKMYGSVPDSFSFSPVSGAPLSSLVESETVILSGSSQPTTIAVSGGYYRIGSDEWTNTSGVVNPGATVKVRLSSSASYSTTTATTLTIGGVAGSFTVTTLADTEKPVVSSFVLSTGDSTAMTVGITSFFATDNDQVSGYLVTDSATPPAADHPGWLTPAPATVILSRAGDNLLHAWARDRAGNVSEPRTATVNLKPVRRATGADYVSLQTACDEADNPETIKVLAVTLPESLFISGEKDLTIQGGYDDGYGVQSGYSTIQGTLTVNCRSLAVTRMIVR